jgi:hypothetical protein
MGGYVVGRAADPGAVGVSTDVWGPVPLLDRASRVLAAATSAAATNTNTAGHS